jgi:hypothetical protein
MTSPNVEKGTLHPRSVTDAAKRLDGRIATDAYTVVKVGAENTDTSPTTWWPTRVAHTVSRKMWTKTPSAFRAGRDATYVVNVRKVENTYDPHVRTPAVSGKSS